MSKPTRVLTELAVVPSKEELQNQLNKAIKNIDSKLKKMGANPNYVWKSNLQFKMNQLDGNTINIGSCVDPNYLAMALGKMKRVKREIEESYTDLGITSYPRPQWLTNCIEHWIEDIEYRLKVVANQVLIGQLTQRRQELATHLSAEQRLYETLQNTQDLLK